jgi:non-ribosomal peptide synthetase component E (peptide arylation enzyme)
MGKPRDMHNFFSRSQEDYAPRNGQTAVGATSTEVLRGNNNRKKATFVNDSDEAIYLCKGTPATINQGIRLNAAGGNLVDEPDTLAYLYRGPWTAICASGAKNLTWTEDQ